MTCLNWRWTQWVIAIQMALLLLLFCFAEETSLEVIQRRASHGRKRSKTDVAAMLCTLASTTMLRPLHMLLVEPIVLFFAVYSALYFGILYGFLEAYPWVFSQTYGFNLQETGLMFLSISVGIMIGAAIFMAGHVAQRSQQGSGDASVGQHFRHAYVSSLGLPLALFWFGWSSNTKVHWIVPCLAGVPFGAGSTCFFMSMMLVLSQIYGSAYGASALAATGIVRYTVSAVFPLFLGLVKKTAHA